MRSTAGEAPVMPRAPRSIVLSCLLLLAGSVNVQADDPPAKARRDDDTEELRQKVLEGEHDEAVSAAIELFTSGKPRYDAKHDAFLEGVLKPSNGGGDPKTAT